MKSDNENINVYAVLERIAVQEEKSKTHSTVIEQHRHRITGLEDAYIDHSKILNQHDTELKLQSHTIESKFDATIKQFETLDKSINSLKDVVDKIAPVLQNMISSKKGADKAKARIAKIILSTIAAGGTLVGTFVAVTKYIGS